MNLHDHDIRYEAHAEGVAEGTRQKAEADAIEFLKEKVSPETVAKCVKLPLAQVLELQKKIPNQA